MTADGKGPGHVERDHPHREYRGERGVVHKWTTWGWDAASS